MAEERTLGLARAPQASGQEESIEELQRRLELARDSISHTVTEIKENVANQVQAVKDTLDWREQFKKRPVAWSAGAAGVGFLTGYAIARAFKNEPTEYDYIGYGSTRAQKLASTADIPPAYSTAAQPAAAPASYKADEGPGIMGRLKESPAYDSVSKEVSSLGNQLVKELSSTASLVVLPFLVSKLKEMLGVDKLEKQAPESRTRNAAPRTDWSEPDRTTKRDSVIGHS